ncbi:iron transporter FeoA [Synergistales bacterium]|nr:iron transporter FeoA [Synergistales bacterium]
MPGISKTLKDFTTGEKGSVISLSATGAVRRRLLDMGITPGADIVMRKVAPLGDPVELTVRGYQLSIRKAEAENILMSVSGVEL